METIDLVRAFFVAIFFGFSLVLALTIPFDFLRGAKWDLHEIAYMAILLALFANILRKRNGC